MPFTPGDRLPAEVRDAQDGVLYHVVRPDLQLVTFVRLAGTWHWRFLNGSQPDGMGTWADAQRIQAGGDP
ncbi:hypothetical protein [Deinococcus sedimenti]|uniref:Uncharacterized protein n=1 Tax=Deinococcus sedimenti TaxID=1867090 RepID=A0ABQ2S980_9DEIO|nr:hypothetical protein [Deinococcus sedimenti]GGS10192.1 hypothetical protein GCM10008960_40410 [Deinococcus sedimenti]